MTTEYLPAPLTEGHLCPDCKGTGCDVDATRRARRRSLIDRRSYITCGSCNGNGLDPAAYFRWTNS
ncbi:MAG TPA: hypothetical protein VEH04_17015 [Verrucomicrobiae bacterium]|nr:hypothetical protein [Verrucomicrobiae bacterium]